MELNEHPQLKSQETGELLTAIVDELEKYRIDSSSAG